MKPQHESYSDYYQTEHELKINNMEKPKPEMILPDTLESLVAQLSIKAMQCIDSKNRERVFEFNDEEFEEYACNMINTFVVRGSLKNQAI